MEERQGRNFRKDKNEEIIKININTSNCFNYSNCSNKTRKAP